MISETKNHGVVRNLNSVDFISAEVWGLLTYQNAKSSSKLGARTPGHMHFEPLTCGPSATCQTHPFHTLE
jgi:hypothetical protein